MATMQMYDGMVYGVEVSRYGKENGKLDYEALSRMVGSLVKNNNIKNFGYDYADGWELINGDERNEYGEYEVPSDYFIITKQGAEVLKTWTDEIVYYCEDLDMYLWAICFGGLSWEYALTDIELHEMKGE